MTGTRSGVQWCRFDSCGHAAAVTSGISTGTRSSHQGKSECALQQRQLFIDERGTSGDLTEIFVRCECGNAERSVAQAARFQDRALGSCDGSRPWLGPYTKEACGEPSRLLIRSASNAYFPQPMSVISLPDRDESVRKAIEAAWDYLEIVETREDLEREMRRPKVREALDGISLDEAFAQIQARRTRRAHAGQIREAHGTGNAGRRKGRDRLGSARRRFLRPMLAQDDLGPAVDEAD